MKRRRATLVRWPGRGSCGGRRTAEARGDLRSGKQSLRRATIIPDTIPPNFLGRNAMRHSLIIAVVAFAALTIGPARGQETAASLEKKARAALAQAEGDIPLP